MTYNLIITLAPLLCSCVPALTNGRRTLLVVIIMKGMIFQLFDKKDKKKYLCYTCGHYGICMYEKDYIKAQDKVDNGLIDVMVETPFIRPVKLECKYFVRNGIIPAPR